MDVERQYMRYLKLQRNYSPNTLEAYRHDLDYLLSYCRKNDKDPLDMKLEDTMELSTRDVMAALGVSESTVYRWRKDNKIKYRLSPGGEARFLYVQLELAIKGGGIVVRGMDKNELLDRLCRFKEDVIFNKLAQS